MDRASLDLGYTNVWADPDYQTRIAQFRVRCDALYRTAAAKRDIAYGGRPRERFDWLSCGQIAAPTFVFIHRGYWQNYTKDEMVFVARSPLGRGFNVILAEYTLAPEATMTEIVGEIGRLLDFLQVYDTAVGFGGRPVCLCGHSAGGQLAALHGDHSAVTLTLATSAVFDLEPIVLSWLNEKLSSTREEIGLYTPILLASKVRTIVSVGEAELPELVRRSHSYVAARKERSENVATLSLPGRNHFSILGDLADPDGIHMSTWLRRSPLQAICEISKYR